MRASLFGKAKRGLSTIWRGAARTAGNPTPEASAHGEAVESAPAQEYWGPLKEIYRAAEAVVKFLLLPLLGLVVWVAVVTEFTTLTATDALLIVLAFSVWHSARWLAQRLDDRLARIEAFALRAVFHTAPGATHLEVKQEADGRMTTVLSRIEPEAPKVVDEHGRPRPL